MYMYLILSTWCVAADLVLYNVHQSGPLRFQSRLLLMLILVRKLKQIFQMVYSVVRLRSIIATGEIYSSKIINNRDW